VLARIVSFSCSAIRRRRVIMWSVIVGSGPPIGSTIVGSGPPIGSTVAAVGCSVGSSVGCCSVGSVDSAGIDRGTARRSSIPARALYSVQCAASWVLTSRRRRAASSSVPSTIGGESLVAERHDRVVVVLGGQRAQRLDPRVVEGGNRGHVVVGRRVVGRHRSSLESARRATAPGSASVVHGPGPRRGIRRRGGKRAGCRAGVEVPARSNTGAARAGDQPRSTENRRGPVRYSITLDQGTRGSPVVRAPPFAVAASTNLAAKQ
jgi:hypothetical protein